MSATAFGNLIVKRRGTTYSGLGHDVVKSALQKYIRRGETEKAQLVAADADLTLVAIYDANVDTDTLVHTLGEDTVARYAADHPELNNISVSAKQFITNLANRLRVCAVEDVGLGNRCAPSMVEHYLSCWNKKRGESNRKALMELVSYLSKSPHIRLVSDLKTVFLLPPYYWSTTAERDRYLHIHHLMETAFPEIVPPVLASTPVENLKLFQESLENKDLMCFYYLGQYLLADGNMVSVSTIIQKEEQKATIECQREIDVLLRWYREMTHAERPIYLYQAILLLLYPAADVPLNESESRLRSELELESEYNLPYERLLSGQKIEIDDYCLDIHTVTGRRAGCTTELFAREGSQVANEAIQYLIPLYRRLYVVNKVAFDNVLSDTEILELLSQGLQAQPQVSQKIKIVRKKKQIQDVPVPVPVSASVPVPTQVPVSTQVPTQVQERIIIRRRVKPATIQQATEPATIQQATEPATIQQATEPATIQQSIEPATIQQSIEPATIQQSIEPATIQQAPLETEMFDLIARAQLVTSANKTDVYFATVRQPVAGWQVGSRVIVKGPYKTPRGPLHAISMNNLKRELGMPHLQNMVHLELVPDRWIGQQGLGTRYSLRSSICSSNGDTMSFLVSDDLLASIELPIKLHSSAKWPPTEVVDFEQISAVRWVPAGANEQQMYTYCTYLMLRYLAGLGDLADRNFLVLDDTVYGLDEDCPTISGNSPPGRELRTKKAAIVQKYILANWDKMVAFRDKIPEVYPGLVLKNPGQTFCDLESTLQLFSA